MSMPDRVFSKWPGRPNPYVVLFELVHMMTTGHFQSPGLLDDQRMDHALEAGKQLLRSTRTKVEARTLLGLWDGFWIRLTALMFFAVPSLEQQAFAANESVASTQNGSLAGTSSQNFLPLLKNVERINDLCMVARNTLASSTDAQDFCADIKFDQRVLTLIDVCIRVAGRGYDGEASTRSEEKWQKVVDAFKKLLITCLQLLHNLVMNNERRKLLLWMDLFGSSTCADPSFMGRVDPAAYLQYEPRTSTDQTRTEIPQNELEKDLHEKAVLREPSAGAITSVLQNSGLGNTAGISEALESGKSLAARIKAINDELEQASLREAQEYLASVAKQTAGASTNTDRSDDGPQKKIAGEVKKVPAAERASRSSLLASEKVEGAEEKDQHDKVGDASAKLVISPTLVDCNWNGLQSGSITDHSNDSTVPCTPDMAAENLKVAKEQLIERLFQRVEEEEEGPEVPVGEAAVGKVNRDFDSRDPAEALGGANVGSPEEEQEEEDGEDDEDDDEDYEGQWDRERGLLTDIPLVLGQYEIEPLAMIVQTGIVDMFASEPPYGIHENMQSIRRNVLISQESGRNLLKELLIFIAVWDMQEEKLYFKIMMQIMDALLTNGLVPYMYLSFAEPKDIISPAQAVIIKLLTQLFRATHGQPGADEAEEAKGTTDADTLISRFHTLIVRYLFTHFRQSVIPETCSLIYLQGEISAGRVHEDEFPLNLWDMERVYEGVYQYLEFFSVLAESDKWKKLLVDWELAFELVTLLKELDACIPNGPLSSLKSSTSPRNVASSSTSTSFGPTPVSVERPFEPNPPSPPPTPTTPPCFPWRNLKKLSILVLTSLAWHSPTVQNQVGAYGGIEALLSCTKYDAHNPVIDQHAIFCLRLMLEGNPANQKVISELQARAAVRSEELSKAGFEAELDDKGQVRLKRKEGGSSTAVGRGKERKG
ncbi:MAG: copper transport protein [Piccolia ochrophora]|nr:MAG: copper transport protein [Piccolia ochrophora]